MKIDPRSVRDAGAWHHSWHRGLHMVTNRLGPTLLDVADIPIPAEMDVQRARHDRRSVPPIGAPLYYQSYYATDASRATLAADESLQAGRLTVPSGAATDWAIDLAADLTSDQHLRHRRCWTCESTQERAISPARRPWDSIGDHRRGAKGRSDAQVTTSHPPKLAR
jgi:hypothetical protein